MLLFIQLALILRLLCAQHMKRRRAEKQQCSQCLPSGSRWFQDKMTQTQRKQNDSKRVHISISGSSRKLCLALRLVHQCFGTKQIKETIIFIMRIFYHNTSSISREFQSSSFLSGKPPLLHQPQLMALPWSHCSVCTSFGLSTDSCYIIVVCKSIFAHLSVQKDINYVWFTSLHWHFLPSTPVL